MEGGEVGGGVWSWPQTQRKGGEKKDASYHVIHKIPEGDSPYGRAKHLQLVEKDPEASIAWFWKAINSGDRVESALKDMAVVMKQLDRAAEAVEAIRSFRHRCGRHSQEALDNVLIELYKKCGMIDDQIALLKRKLRRIYLGQAFNGRTTKTARSHGKKCQVSIHQEISRLLGNLGWAYMQQSNYIAAEAVYRKAQMIEPDTNKALNLGHCLLKQGRIDEARWMVDDVLHRRFSTLDEAKTMSRAEELMHEIESSAPFSFPNAGSSIEDIISRLEDLLVSDLGPFRSKRLPIFEEISPLKDQVSC